jgi:Ca-activated chloride channel family protein
MRFLDPAWLLLLIVVTALAAAYVTMALRRRSYAVRFTNLALLQSVAPRRAGWRRHVSAATLLLALVALTLAMGKPAAQVKVPRQRATVMLAIDVSLSMKATDVSPSRLAAAESAAKTFVGELPKSFNLGLVSFAGTATVVVPPTKDHAEVDRAVDGLRLAESTATGEAVFACLQAIHDVPAGGAKGPPPARIVLLSDGFRTVGRPNSLAATAAVEAGVPISTIGFGTDSGAVLLQGQWVPVPVDRAALRELARSTGGKYYSAVSGGQLRDVYRDLGSSIGYRTAYREVTRWFVGTGLFLALCAAAMSLAWTSRLP